MIRRGVVYLLWTPVRWLLILAYAVLVLAKFALLVAIVFGLVALGDLALQAIGH